MRAGMWRSGGLSLLAGLVAALCLQAPVDAQTNTGSAKPPIILLPGMRCLLQADRSSERTLAADVHCK